MRWKKTAAVRRMEVIECRKLLHAKTFWIMLLLGLIIVTFNTLYMVSGTADSVDEYTMLSGVIYNPNIYAYTLYNTWIGNESGTFAFSVYYFLFPMLVMLAYGWSLGAEIHSGYIKNVAVRMCRSDYFRVKYKLAFLGGGIVGVVPLLANFLTDALFIPAIKPDLLYPFYVLLQSDCLADFYSSHPLCFNLFFVSISFIYFGLMAGCAAVCAFLAKNRIMTVLLPAGVIYFLHYISTILPYPTFLYDLSPLYCIHPTPVGRHSNGLVIVAYLLIMTVFALIVLWRKGNEYYEIL